MNATVVYVHGIGNKPPKEVLKGMWDQALTGNSSPAPSRLAYWAPVRYPEPISVGFEVAQEQFSSGGNGFEAIGLQPTEAFVESTLAELPQSDAPAFRRLLEEMAYAADAAAVGSESLPSGHEALPGPRFLRVAVFRALVHATLKDVHAYFFQNEQADAIRQSVRDVLDGIDGPVVVVGHSLGSVVAYDVLHEESYRTLAVPLFVTLGSPLGITEIQDHIRKPLEVPSTVEAWLNVADPADIVALDPTVRPEYKPSDRCTDAMVVNTSRDRHGISEYLSTQVVRSAIGRHVSVLA